MGGEFGQWTEWNHETSLGWHLLDNPVHSGLKRWMEDLNRVYRREPALHEVDFDPAGFEWIDCNDVEHSTISFIRFAWPPLFLDHQPPSLGHCILHEEKAYSPREGFSLMTL